MDEKALGQEGCGLVKVVINKPENEGEDDEEKDNAMI